MTAHADSDDSAVGTLRDARVRHLEKPSRTLRGALNSPPPGIQGSPRHDAAARSLWIGFGEAWTAIGYVFGGIAVWGGIGLVADRWLGTRPLLTVVGTLVGNVGGIYLIFVRLMPRAPAGGGGSGGRHAA